jgi:quinol monooxygenase YgiN
LLSGYKAPALNTLKSGTRDALIKLFQRELTETQEATGIVVIGQFRDLNNPDRFVWLCGFSNMATHATALQEFYRGPVWKARRGYLILSSFANDLHEFNGGAVRVAHIHHAFAGIRTAVEGLRFAGYLPA